MVEMKTKANIFSLPTHEKDAVCVTVNNALRKNGNGIMGKGIALEALNLAPEAERILGEHIRKYGDSAKICVLNTGEYHMLSFPTKHHWREKSDINLIAAACRELMAIKQQLGLRAVYLPPLGCGLGGLNWEKDVKPVVSKILDDQCIIVHRFP